MDKRRIAVIGDPNSVMIFKAIGLDVCYEEKAEEIEKRIHELAEKGYAAIYITKTPQRWLRTRLITTLPLLSPLLSRSLPVLEAWGWV